MNLAALPSDCAHPTLLFYIYGDCSSYIGSLLAPFYQDRDDAKTANILNQFFKSYYSRLPGYEDGNDACKPVSFLPTLWCLDEFAGYGSYSNFPIGLEHGDRDIETIREGMPDRGIWFAGEHTVRSLT